MQILVDGSACPVLPRGERRPEAPERFAITLALGGLPRWAICYHAAQFEDTYLALSTSGRDGMNTALPLGLKGLQERARHAERANPTSQTHKPALLR